MTVAELKPFANDSAMRALWDRSNINIDVGHS